MKRGSVLAVYVLAVCLAAGTALANCGGCGKSAKAPAKKACPTTAVAKSGCPMAAALATMKLTDKQKAKIAKARAACRSTIEKTLTAEQLKKFQAACPAMKTSCK